MWAVADGNAAAAGILRDSDDPLAARTLPFIAHVVIASARAILEVPAAKPAIRRQIRCSFRTDRAVNMGGGIGIRMAACIASTQHGLVGRTMIVGGAFDLHGDVTDAKLIVQRAADVARDGVAGAVGPHDMHG
jgi:hypothetical protein